MRDPKATSRFERSQLQTSLTTVGTINNPGIIIHVELRAEPRKRLNSYSNEQSVGFDPEPLLLPGLMFLVQASGKQFDCPIRALNYVLNPILVGTSQEAMLESDDVRMFQAFTKCTIVVPRKPVS